MLLVSEIIFSKHLYFEIMHLYFEILSLETDEFVNKLILLNFIKDFLDNKLLKLF